MSMRQTQVGEVAVSFTETYQPDPRGDVLAEITVAHSDLSTYHLASVQLRVRRNSSEFPDGQCLTPEAAAQVVAAVKDFFDRNRVPVVEAPLPKAQVKPAAELRAR